MNLRSPKFILPSLLLTALASTVSATELSEIYFGARPFGMGNAYTAIANDEYALFTNPAGVTRARKNRSRAKMHLFKFPNLTVGSNGAFTTFQEVANGDKTIDEFVTEAGADVSKPLWLNFGLNPVGIFEVGSSAIAIGGYSSTRGSAFVDANTPDNTLIDVTIDNAALLNFSWANRTNRFNLGVTVRPMQRQAYKESIPTEELKNVGGIYSDRIAKDSLTMTGLGIDAGMMFTFADFWFPTLGVAALNLPTGCNENFLNPYTKLNETVCGNKFTITAPADPSDSDLLKLSTIDPTDIRVGFSITPRLSRKIALRIAFDMHHLNIPAGTQNLGYSGIETLKLLHAGAELFAGNPLERNNWAVRVGFNQGYYTMGATVKFSLFALEFATFGQDISTSAEQDEDRRYLGNFSIEF